MKQPGKNQLRHNEEEPYNQITPGEMNLPKESTTNNPHIKHDSSNAAEI